MFHVKHPEDFSAADFQAATGVSRETLERLEIYVALLTEWSGRMNLVARSTLSTIWHRHMLDSAQLAPMVPAEARTFVDLGSGAGFPGLVLAIMLADRPGVAVHLIDSTGKKANFLRAVTEKTGAPTKIYNQRIEDVTPFAVDVVTARALAPLDKLIGYAYPFLTAETVCLLMKGQHVEDELTAAHKIWNMRVDRHPSWTEPRGSVLSVCEVSHVKSGSNQTPSSPSG
jgi:16S rRNA (guanine527-N7)-methyltransferase